MQLTWGYIKSNLGVRIQGYFYCAPWVGLEPTTLKLHVTPLFPDGMDYLITQPNTIGAGR